jgi:outer membrane murein-binding lipoprotein Lpp
LDAINGQIVNAVASSKSREIQLEHLHTQVRDLESQVEALYNQVGRKMDEREM